MTEEQNCVAGKTVTFSWDTKIMYDSKSFDDNKSVVVCISWYNEK
jgi:hypothetical protein